MSTTPNPDKPAMIVSTFPTLKPEEYIEPQLDFPVFDLTEDNAKKIKNLLESKKTVRMYHEAGERNFVFRALHPVLIEGLAMVQTDRRLSAMNHGMVYFEALVAAVTSANTERITQSALTLALATPEVAHAITDPEQTQKVSQQFQDEYPRTADVLTSTSERDFGGLGYCVLAGAAVEHAITMRALSIEPRFA